MQNAKYIFFKCRRSLLHYILTYIVIFDWEDLFLITFKKLDIACSFSLFEMQRPTGYLCLKSSGTKSVINKNKYGFKKGIHAMIQSCKVFIHKKLLFSHNINHEFFPP